MIDFVNEPLLSEFEAQAAFNERRIALSHEIQKLIHASPLFSGKKGSAEFVHIGVSSLVSIITTEEEKYVLKVPLSLTDGNGEANFLREWERVGVKVPHVFEDGQIGNHPYLIMEYVDAPQLQEALKRDSTNKESAWKEVGSVLAQMHTAKAKGFGRIVDGKPEYEHFEDWLLGPGIEKRVNTVKELGLLDARHGNIGKAFDTLLAYGEGKTSALCHFDLTPNNILATRPFTIFDPSPMLNHGIIDLGRSVLSTIFHREDQERDALIQGYYGDREYDSQLLHASVLLLTYWKFVYQHKTGRTEAMDNVRTYLEKRANIL